MGHTEGALRLLSDYVKKGAQEKPDHIAFIHGDNKITYREFAEQTEKLACYLMKIGVAKGDRIAYLSIPRPEFFYLYMAASRIGAIIVGIGTRQSDREIEYVLNNSEATYIFHIHSMYEFDYQERFKKILPNCPSVKGLVILDGEAKLENALAFADIMKGDYSEFKDALLEREAQVSTHDGLIIVYTSGSTGVPKGALMSHQNIIHMSLVEIGMCGANSDDIWINHLPVNHVSGATEVGATSIIGNCTQVLEPFNPQKALELVERHKVTILGQVPTMFAMEFALPDYDKYDLSSLRVVVISGAMAPMETLKQMRETMCDNCYNCLGLTEVSGLITYTEPGASLETLNLTVGKVAPDFELKLVDSNRQEVPHGEVGEIAYRGTSVIKEYFKLPDATRAAFDEEGWFYSGDMGMFDEDGNLRMVGRSKEMYITNGENIYPAEIEDAIMRFPGVMLCACVAVPHKISGEVGRAYIVPIPGSEINVDELKEFLKEYLASYKIPREFVFREMLPMTMLGKIEKKLLRQEVEEEIKAGKISI